MWIGDFSTNTIGQYIIGTESNKKRPWPPLIGLSLRLKTTDGFLIRVRPDHVLSSGCSQGSEMAQGDIIMNLKINKNRNYPG